MCKTLKILLLCMIFCADLAAGEGAPAVDLDLGEEINETCAGCHGEYGQGSTDGGRFHDDPDDAGIFREYTDTGIASMLAYLATLDDRGIDIDQAKQSG
jgi:hypothetical protein